MIFCSAYRKAGKYETKTSLQHLEQLNVQPFPDSETSAFIHSVTARLPRVLRLLLTSPSLIKSNGDLPRKLHIPSSDRCGIYLLRFIAHGPHNDPAWRTGQVVLAYPPQEASYAVPVRQYRILQSRFLQTSPHGQRPCDLLTGFTNSPVSDFHSGNKCVTFHT